MDLFKDRDSNVWSAGARALGERAEHHMRCCVPHSLTTPMSVLATVYEISDFVPQIINLLAS